MKKKQITYVQLPDGRTFAIILPKGTMHYATLASFNQYTDLPEPKTWVEIQ